MVHSVELLFDPDTEASVRKIWDDLRDAGIPIQAGRPHTTLTVAEHIDPDVDARLASLLPRFPLSCRLGAPLFFGHARAVLARLLVPTTQLLDIHAQVHRMCLPHLHPGPMPNTLPGQWTAHVTVARRVVPAQLALAVQIGGKPREIDGAVVGLRRWDGDARTEHRIG